MAKEEVSELQASEIKIGTQKAVESINKLKSAVKDSTNEWKVMESQLKQSGDAVGASEAKYNQFLIKRTCFKSCDKSNQK
ncbi:hypothetical protein [Weissella hellenica]|uniref:hypothetical protein n=1 Tax=Weissella hellenica TaxID=46256 RepID=UPI00388B7BA2